MPGIRRQMMQRRPIAKRPTSGRPLPRPKPGSMRPKIMRAEVRQAANQMQNKVKNAGPIRTALAKVKAQERKPVTGGTTPQRGPALNKVPQANQTKPAFNKVSAADSAPQNNAPQNKLPAGVRDKVASLNKKRKTY